MRNITLLLLLLGSLTCVAQKKLDSYNLQYFNKEYSIEASQDKKDGFSVYIGLSAETASSEARIMVSSKNLNDFIAALNETKKKYLEWSQVAKDNKVDNMSKDIDVKFPSVDIAWLGSKWFFAFGQRLKPKFFILEDGRHVVTFVNNNKSSSNNYITESTYWVFSDGSEFDDLISRINYETIKSKLQAEESKKDLFN